MVLTRWLGRGRGREGRLLGCGIGVLGLIAVGVLVRREAAGPGSASFSALDTAPGAARR